MDSYSYFLVFRDGIRVFLEPITNIHDGIIYTKYGSYLPTTKGLFDDIETTIDKLECLVFSENN